MAVPANRKSYSRSRKKQIRYLYKTKVTHLSKLQSIYLIVKKLSKSPNSNLY